MSDNVPPSKHPSVDLPPPKKKRRRKVSSSNESNTSETLSFESQGVGRENVSASSRVLLGVGKECEGVGGVEGVGSGDVMPFSPVTCSQVSMVMSLLKSIIPGSAKVYCTCTFTKVMVKRPHVYYCNNRTHPLCLSFPMNI